jgi:hypothetical protein
VAAECTRGVSYSLRGLLLLLNKPVKWPSTICFFAGQGGGGSPGWPMSGSACVCGYGHKSSLGWSMLEVETTGNSACIPLLWGCQYNGVR